MTSSAEKFFRRFASRRAQFFQRTYFYLRHGFGNFFDISRFAALAAIRHGREIRAVGFQHEFVQRRGGHGVADILRVLEGDDAGEADERADLKNPFHALDVSPKQWNTPRVLPMNGFICAMVSSNAVRWWMTQFKSEFGGDFHLLPENLRLFFFVARVIGGGEFRFLARQW
jgi:hypothetical protein